LHSLSENPCFLNPTRDWHHTLTFSRNKQKTRVPYDIRNFSSVTIINKMETLFWRIWGSIVWSKKSAIFIEPDILQGLLQYTWLCISLDLDKKSHLILFSHTYFTLNFPTKIQFSYTHSCRLSHDFVLLCVMTAVSVNDCNEFNDFIECDDYNEFYDCSVCNDLASWL